LLLAQNGNFYGATDSGSQGAGAIFQMTTNGTVTIIYTFDGTQGVGLEGNLIQGPNGDLYGTTVNGGTNDLGTVFKLSLGTPSTPAPVILSEALGDGVFGLTWRSVAGKEYKVQYNTDLTTGEWIDVGPHTLAAGMTMSGTDPTATGAQRYYRVVLLP
jgi:uncharacterized repeat protein (TIGR03803 family)